MIHFRAPASRSRERREVPDGDAWAGAPVRLPLRVLDRHGLVAGATGTGKTKPCS